MTVMENVVALAPVVKTVEVKRTAEDAFRIFTGEIAAWWPMGQHTRAKTAAGERTERVDMDPRVGGRLYETLTTGEEREWGEVLAVEPGRRIRFSFSMSRTKDFSGEVEVTFDPTGPESCRVTLTHTHWERYGDEADPMRRAFDNGWDEVFTEGFGGFANKG